MKNGTPGGGVRRSNTYQTIAIHQRQTADSEVLPQVRRQLEASAQRLETFAHEWRPAPESRAPDPTPAYVQGLRGRISLNLGTQSVLVDGNVVRLTANELAILRLLTLRIGTFVTKPDLYRGLYGRRRTTDPKIIDVLICTLRKKLSSALGGEACIMNVRGKGYMVPA